MNASHRESNRRGNFALSHAGHTAMLAAGFALLSAGSAMATVISPNSGVTNIPSNGTVGINGTIGTSGYYFYNGSGGTQLAPSDILPNWMTSVTPFTGLGTFSGAGYSTFSLSTGSSTSNFTSSVVYTTAGSSATLATITLSNSNPIPGTFQIGVLGDNSSGAANDATYTLTESTSLGALITSAVLTSDPGTASGVNNFYTADISGASAGDIIRIIGSASSAPATPAHYAVGGFTVDAVPEPASLSLIALGSLGLLARHRRTSASVD